MNPITIDRAVLERIRDNPSVPKEVFTVVCAALANAELRKSELGEKPYAQCTTNGSKCTHPDYCSKGCREKQQ